MSNSERRVKKTVASTVVMMLIAGVFSFSEWFNLVSYIIGMGAALMTARAIDDVYGGG